MGTERKKQERHNNTKEEEKTDSRKQISVALKYVTESEKE